MKILILCNHGNVRSVGLKYLIQRLYGDKHDVLAAGVEENSNATLKLLMDWADKVISLTDEANSVASYKGDNNKFIDIGRDTWFNPFHHELQHKLLKHIKDLNL